MRRDFAIAYAVLFVVCCCALTVLGVSVLVHPKKVERVRGLSPITNQSTEYQIDQHFSGQPLGSGSATHVGLPAGTCIAYGDLKNWIVLKCYASAIPPQMPSSPHPPQPH